tara:strand:+ start:437 stop:1030 length:594 start_codon:yes stop_codon:yes gene_type:complete
MGYVGAVITQNVVDTADIADGSITTAKLATNAVRDEMPSGSVIQTVQANKTDRQLIESTSFVSILEKAITPSASSSKILIMAYVTSGGNGHWDFKVTRNDEEIEKADGTDVGLGDQVGSNRARSASHHWYKQYDGTQATIVLLDYPNTTSEITYKLKGASPHDASSYDITVNYQYTDSDTAWASTTITSLTVQEIKG